jgi:hypothetical protein
VGPADHGISVRTQSAESAESPQLSQVRSSSANQAQPEAAGHDAVSSITARSRASRVSSESTSRAGCSSPAGASELTTTILGAGQLADLVERMLPSSSRRIDTSTPFVYAMLPDGSRLHVVIPDVTGGTWRSTSASSCCRHTAWLARQLCDHVAIRRGSAGVSVRLITNWS